MQATTKAQARRLARLLPSPLTPRYVRCYDNGGKTADRYTIVFTGNYRRKTGGVQVYVGSSGEPTNPQGFYQHGESPYLGSIDTPTYGHLGKKVRFQDLPEKVRTCVLADYVLLWGLPKV